MLNDPRTTTPDLQKKGLSAAKLPEPNSLVAWKPRLRSSGVRLNAMSPGFKGCRRKAKAPTMTPRQDEASR